jgi:hypothetical protein
LKLIAATLFIFARSDHRRVFRSMAVGTQGDEVFFRVVSQPAAEFPVVDLQVSRRTAQLTTPSVSL